MKFPFQKERTIKNERELGYLMKQSPFRKTNSRWASWEISRHLWIRGLNSVPLISIPNQINPVNLHFQSNFNIILTYHIILYSGHFLSNFQPMQIFCSSAGEYHMNCFLGCCAVQSCRKWPSVTGYNSHSPTRSQHVSSHKTITLINFKFLVRAMYPVHLILDFIVLILLGDVYKLRDSTFWKNTHSKKFSGN